MSYNYKNRTINLDTELVNQFNKAMNGCDQIDDNLIEMYIATSDLYNEESDNILEVVDKLIEKGKLDEFINNCLKNELL